MTIPRTSLFDEPAPIREDMKAIRADLGDCKRCKLAPTRSNIVFGVGDPHAELMFVGEAPGADEDAQGLPFVGRAGQLLTKIIQAIDMRREDVYICNILKCRPPSNRNPESDEIAACEPFLFRQIASVQPRVICALGTFAAQTLLRTKEPIHEVARRLHGFPRRKADGNLSPRISVEKPERKAKGLGRCPEDQGLFAFIESVTQTRGIPARCSAGQAAPARKSAAGKHQEP